MRMRLGSPSRQRRRCRLCRMCSIARTSLRPLRRPLLWPRLVRPRRLLVPPRPRRQPLECRLRLRGPRPRACRWRPHPPPLAPRPRPPQPRPPATSRTSLRDAGFLGACEFSNAFSRTISATSATRASSCRACSSARGWATLRTRGRRSERRVAARLPARPCAAPRPTAPRRALMRLAAPYCATAASLTLLSPPRHLAADRARHSHARYGRPVC